MKKIMMRRGRYTFAALAALVCAASLGNAPPAAAGVLAERSADYKWRLCPPLRMVPQPPRYSETATPSDTMEIRCDASRVEKGGLTQFTGDVELIRGDLAIRSDVINYDDALGRFEAEGRTQMWNAGMIWSGQAATYSMDQSVSELEDGQYWLLGGRGRGHARRLKHDKDAQVTELESVDYSTCPLPEEGWRVSASTIRLDHRADRGSARNAVLRVKEVPILYFPYINFPISDKRKSGFLAPAIGTTNESGFDTRVPYYWNIAPNHDATITPRILSDRGVMIGGEYRYLDENYFGEVDFEYLPGDKLRDDQDRSAVSIEHQQRFADNSGLLNVLLNNVSDDAYFEDFGRSISVTSQRFLDRQVDISYRKQFYQIYGLVQAYQTIDDSLPAGASPYRRLPQVTFSGSSPRAYWGVVPSLVAQTTYFDRPESVSGARIDVQPSVTLPIIRTFLDVRPKFSVRHTEYLLDDPNRSFDDHETRDVPIFSLDSNLFLEREASLFGHEHIQTFEPRAFYLLVPNVGQEELPVFDSGLYSTSFQTLFLENRFAGADRVGDANQMALAFTSRMIDLESGREAYRLSVGQVIYFRDREIIVPGGIFEDDSTSDFIAEAATNLGADWSARGIVQWNPDEAQTNLSAVTLRYHPDLDTVVNFGYRFRRVVNDIEQADFSIRWPLTRSIAVIGRWNYSMQENRSIETLGGVEYESCCWGLRIVGRRFLRNSQGEFDNGVFAQVQFRGLGGLGQRADSFLSRGIPGYEDPFE